MTQGELLRLIDEAAEDGRTTLDLSGQGLDELPPEIGKLTNLKTLVLGQERWWGRKNSGQLNNNLQTLPDEIGRLTELRSLDLSGNRLSSLSESIGQLSNLQSLKLYSIGLSRLPESIGQLSNLQSLSLSYNQLSSLPESIGQLSNLQSLELRRNQLSSLPEIIGQITSLRSLDLSHNQLSSLSESIGQLSNLQSLKLYSIGLSRLSESIGQLSNLQSLSLSYNQLSSLPESIGQLSNLQSLELRRNQLSSLPESIGQLSNLQSIHLDDNQLTDLPESIGRLGSLDFLVLGSNRLSRLPESIGQLSKLKSLRLYSNRLSRLPESIGQLQSLKLLDPDNNQLSRLPESIGQLQSLQKLSLNSNQLNNLPESIGQLQSLQSLDLGLNQLSNFPESIGRLQSLKSLNLSGNQISILSEEIGQLSNLTSLELGGNQLSTLPESVRQLSNLQSLDLSFNRLSTLTESIRQLKSLKSLNLCSNQIASLPKWARLLKSLNYLDLRGNPLPIPPEILGSRAPGDFFSALEERNTLVSYDDSTTVVTTEEKLDFYFSLQTEAVSVPLYEAKLILIGEGGAGKTSLAKKIDNEAYKLPENEKSTEGIDVIRWDFPLPDGNTFRVNIWDFGGQEIYHATHQFFLTKRSLYLLVADTRQENTDFYYWLKIVELLSDSSPVLVIKNEKQDRQCNIDEGLFKSQFNSLKEYLPTNLKENRGLDKIKDAIRYHISQLPHVGTPLPKNWVRVRSALENYSQNCNTLTVDQYCNLCRQNGFTDKSQMLFLSSYLHDLGVCLHFQDDKLLKRTVILKPEWATAAVYKVADSDTVRNHKGRFTEADTEAIWADSEYANLRDELLQLMMRFKLAYELPNRPGHYIAPQLLPISKPDYSWDTTDNLILRYTYDFMPKGILTRFIVETHQSIQDPTNLWKNGVVLADNWASAQVIENYPKKEINVRVSGSNKKPLLEKIRYELWKIHESYERLQYAELIPCNCQQCKGSDKPESYAYELLMKYIGDRRYEIECRGSYEQVDVRRLISDITDQSVRDDTFESRSRGSLLGDPYSRFRTQPQFIHNGDIYHQHGSGDNVAGKKVEGNNIDTQNNSQQELQELSQILDTLVADISQDYVLTKPRVGSKIQRDALERIEEDPKLQQRLTNALKAGFEETLEQMVKNPFAKIVIKSCQGFLKSD